MASKFNIPKDSSLWEIQSFKIKLESSDLIEKKDDFAIIRYIITGTDYFFVLAESSRFRCYYKKFYKRNRVSLGEIIGELPEQIQDLFILHLNLFI